MALAVSAIAVASAFASVGRITKASTTPDGTRGDLAGEVEWTGCAHQPPKPPKTPKEEGFPESPTCTWTAYATVGPGSSPEACEGPGRHLSSLGSGVQLVWQGETRTGLGSEAFEVNDFALEAGAGEMLCLATAEKSTDGTTLPCVPPPEPPPGWHCPYVWTTYFDTLDSRQLEPAGEAEGLPSHAVSSGEPPKECACPALGATSDHRRHRRHHYRHRRISLSQHQKVS